LKNGSAISGATSTTLSITNISLEAEGAYSVMVSSGTENIERDGL
jgi:hypothetical protein